jgi:LysM repeat protein
LYRCEAWCAPEESRLQNELQYLVALVFSTFLRLPPAPPKLPCSSVMSCARKMWRATLFVTLAFPALSKLHSPKICDCTTIGCATDCRILDPNAFCGTAVSTGASFTDGSGCSCSWGLTYATGAVKCVPGSAPTPAPSGKCHKYTVQDGDTCQSIATNFNTTIVHISLGYGDTCEAETILRANEIVNVCPIILPPGCYYYKIVPNDTCSSIAASHNVTRNDITTADGYACPWMIYPGQQVIICPNNGSNYSSWQELEEDLSFES